VFWIVEMDHGIRLAEEFCWKKNKSQTKGLGPCLLKAEKLNTGISF
jgi:hypothetical protein